MRFECRAVDEGFPEGAPWRFRSSAELPVSASEAFAILEDASSWPKWIPAIRHVEWTSPKPFGVGTTRTVRLTPTTVFEHFFRWEPGSRFSFYVVAHRAPVPLFEALAEDYLLEPLDGKRCRFTYSVGIDPAMALKLTGPLGRRNLGRVFTSAPAALARFAASSSP